MRIYIRHGEKEYKNGKSEKLKHDPGIVFSSKKIIREKTKELILLYGIPDKIICSPYKRTRETAEIMNEIADVDIKIDVLLSEYLSYQKNSYLDVCEETAKYNPPHSETKTKFLERIIKHDDIESLYENMFKEKKEIIWYITHGLYIKNLAFLRGNPISYPGYLDTFILY